MSYWINITVALISFALAAVIGIVLIPFLKKIHFGQTILDIGPAWHKSKQGTPIMGGFMFIISSVAAVIAGYLIYRSDSMIDLTDKVSGNNAVRLLTCIIFSLLFAGIGFLDDYIKAVKKQNLGLNPKQKMIMQFILSAALLAMLYALGDKSTEIDFIFFKIDFGILYYPVMILFIIYVSNAVNLTDGVDGLCGSVTFITMLALAAVCGILKSYEISIYATAIAGGCLGFLIWNLHPAKCFMGDTGSTFLGFVLAVTSILGVFKGYALLALVVSIFCIGLPIFDTIFAMLRRMAKHQPIMQADRGHLHHKLIDHGFSQKKAVLIMYAISIFLGLLAIFIAVKDSRIFVVALLTVVVLSFIIYYFNAHIKNKNQ